MLRSTISRSLSVALLLGMVGVTGCATNNDAAGNNNVRTNNVQEAKSGRLNVNSVRDGRNGAHTINKLELSQDLADRIAAMKDVRSANVLLAGDSAYVAVTLDEAGSGTNDRSTTNAAPIGAGSGRGGGGILTGQGGSITGTGGTMTDPARHRGASGRMGIGRMGSDGMGSGGIGTGTDRGIGTRGTTAGNRMNGDTDSLSGDIKAKISAEIKRYAPQIDAVYVSANPDFVQRVNSYADQARGGHPLQGFVNEFRTMVERIFPTRVDNNR
ncbi:YhcN/YlaJ family sporulation lipoprotein [Paenibacillus sp. BR2-3]|uniref:YhcN/YlaJ family sporulation lipoprotein n=1 Tax=Paenibacillus sp. BR2-3 TaxID=3048494 RepID=UPI00397795DC